jgi:hypothetical protein
VNARTPCVSRSSSWDDGSPIQVVRSDRRAERGLVVRFPLAPGDTTPRPLSDRFLSRRAIASSPCVRMHGDRRRERPGPFLDRRPSFVGDGPFPGQGGSTREPGGATPRRRCLCLGGDDGSVNAVGSETAERSPRERHFERPSTWQGDRFPLWAPGDRGRVSAPRGSSSCRPVPSRLVSAGPCRSTRGRRGLAVDPAAHDGPTAAARHHHGLPGAPMGQRGQLAPGAVGVRRTGSDSRERRRREHPPRRSSPLGIAQLIHILLPSCPSCTTPYLPRLTAPAFDSTVRDSAELQWPVSGSQAPCPAGHRDRPGEVVDGGSAGASRDRPKSR